jgi:hypothetical protein
MKHPRSRIFQEGQLEHELPDDGIDDQVWRRLVSAIAAGSRGDADEMVRYWSEHERQISNDQRGLAGVYVWYILQYRVIEIVDRVPTVGDLSGLVNNIYPKFARLILRDEDYLLRVLMSIFNLISPEQQVRGGEIVVSGSAAISALLENPAGELILIRPHLSQWLMRNRSRLDELGITSN